RQRELGWMLWGGVFLIAWVLIALSPDRHPVNESYTDGANAWRNEAPLYNGGGTGFIYPPQAALLHLPFLLLPKLAYEFAWRLATVGLFAAGVYRLSVCAEGDPPQKPGLAGRRWADDVGPGSLVLLTTLLPAMKT